MSDMTELQLQFFVLASIWAVVFVILIAHLWRQRQRIVGITVTYVIFLAAGYWLQGAIYALPWYEPIYPPETILSGFQTSLIAFVAFTIGVVVVMPFLKSFHTRIAPTVTPVETEELVSRETLYKITWVYIVSGLLVYLILTLVIGDIPTLGALLSGIQRLYHVGILFLIWLTFTDGTINVIKSLIIGFLVIIWPILTITRDGFLGFGLVPISLLVVFPMFRFLKPKIILVTVSVVVFVVMSIVMTYFGSRDIIRSVAWGGATTETRLNTIRDAFAGSFRVVNIFDPEQLAVIDHRFALNWLTGRGIQRLESGIVQYANGETLRDAFLMILPRALWPDKPLVVGGQALVNHYAGVYMYGGTSVALGQVLELYVNFGIFGVGIGFVLLGVIFSTMDRKVAELLTRNNLFQAAVWTVPCFGLWLVEDNFLTIVGGAISAVIAVIVFNTVLRVVFSKSLKNTRYREIISRNEAESAR